MRDADDASIERARAAVVALYDARSTRATRDEANAHLMALSEDPRAASVALGLLERARGDANVAYYAANALSATTRSRERWNGASEGAREAMMRRTTAAFAATANDETTETAARRLGLALARGGARMGSAKMREVVETAFGAVRSSGVGSSAMRAGMELLALAAEACDEAETSSRRELAMACANEGERVLITVREVFSACGSARSRQTDALKASCVRAARGWLKLDPSGDVGGGLRLSPTEFAVRHGQLFGDVLQCLAIESGGCGAAAVDFLVDLHQGRSGGEAEEFQAMNAVTRGLLAHASAANDSDDGVSLARNICLVAVALSERCVSVLARGDEDSLALVSLILSLMERHGREVTEVAVDFFLMMDVVGVSSRHESLRAPMHARLTEVLLKQATLPDDFTTWAVANEDEDTFERFREHVVADLLDNCYGVLRGQYFSIIGSALGAAQNWQAAEAGAFALRAPASRVNDDLEDAPSEEIETFLAQLLSTISEHTTDNSGLFSSHQLVRAGTCRLIASYANWLGRRGPPANSAAQAARARGVLMYITSSFPHPPAWSRAALAFKSVCSRCARHLKEPSTFAALLEHTERCIADVRLTFESEDDEDGRASVTEGLARVIAAMPVQQASEASARLIAPVLARCKRIAAEMAPQIPPNQIAHASAARAMAAELALIAASVRFLEFLPSATIASSCEHPAISVLAAAWPTLEEIVAKRTWQAPSVIKAAAEIYVAALLSAKESSVNMIVPMLESIARTFMATKCASLLEPIATAIEVASISSPESGTSELLPSAPHVGATLSAAFSQIARETVRGVRSGSDDWDLAEALFSTARTFVIFAPAQGLANETLFDVLDLSVAALELREYAPVRASLALLNAIISPGEKAKRSAPWVANACRVDEYFLSRGPLAANAILRAACAEITPRACLRPAASFLATLLHTAPDVVTPWIITAIDALEPIHPARERFATTLARRPPLPHPRLVAALCDFVFIAIGVGDVDDLLAYDV